MKQRFLNIIKWILIVFGVIFVLEVLVFSGVIIGANSFSKIDNPDKISKRLKEAQPIIQYVEKYRQENNEYPQKVENIKIKPGFDYKYEVSKDNNCYTVTIDSKKDNTTRQYQHCTTQSTNSNSSSQSYVEFSN